MDESPTQPLASAVALADGILSLVSERTPTAVHSRDRNDQFLALAFGRATRCFRSIRDLPALHAEADDVYVLTRALTEVCLRSLWVATPEEPAERLRRRRVLEKDGLMHLRRQGRAIEKVGLDFGVPPASFDERIDHLGKLGAGGMPPEEAIAREFNLEVVYARVYRVASDASHYSLSTALQGFDFSAVEGKLEELETLSGIPIRFLDGEPERAAGALALATVVYGTFLERSDFVIKHGVAGDALELLQAHVRSAS